MRTLIVAAAAVLLAMPAIADHHDSHQGHIGTAAVAHHHGHQGHIATSAVAEHHGDHGGHLAHLEHLIARQSAHDVATTLDRLAAALTDAGITVFARIDHAAGAAGVGEALAPTELLIFGNPRLGTPLMQSEPAIGLDLPLKALAWENADGQVWLAYTDPSALAARYGIADRAEVFERMAGALARLTSAATGE